MSSAKLNQIQPAIHKTKTKTKRKMKRDTLCGGFGMRCTKAITVGEYDAMLGELSAAVGHAIGRDWAAEGGFQFEDVDYKTMRHHMSVAFPQDIRLNEWKDNPRVLWPQGTHGGTTLKAFHGAPAWTMAQVEAFRDVLIRHGISCTGMPTKDDLKPIKPVF